MRTLDNVIDNYQQTQKMMRLPPLPPPPRIQGPPPIPQQPPLPQYMSGMHAGAGVAPQPQFSDPTLARSISILSGLKTSIDELTRDRARAAGTTMGRIGGAIAGGVAGIAGGGLGIAGAATGEFFGGLGGSLLQSIPGIGHAMRGYQKMAWGGAMEQEAGANQMRQGTFGRISMGAQDMGLGGRGLSATASQRLVQELGTGTKGEFNRQDLTNITSAAADSGFLDAAENVGQIAKVVKSLAGMMGEMAKLTGDPDFRSNIRELANLRNMGLAPEQALSTLRNMNVYGRMAGGKGVAQQGAQMGAGMFQQMGLTPGLGMEMGGGAAGMANLAMGGFTPIQRGILGGKGGVQKQLTGAMAMFMGETAKLALPYAVERGPDGQLRINQERLEEARSGKIPPQELTAKGAANMASMGVQSMTDLMINHPELQTEMGQDLGAVGAFTMMANLTKNLQKMNPQMTTQMAAVTAMRGNVNQGKVLSSMMQNPELISRMRAQIKEEKRQVIKQSAADSAAAAEAADDNEEFWGGVRAVSKSTQTREAQDRAIAQQKKEDEAAGVSRIYSRMQSTTRMQEVAEKRAGSKFTPGMPDDSEIDPITGQRSETRGRYGTLKTGRYRLGEGALGALDTITGRDKWYKSSWASSYFARTTGEMGTDEDLTKFHDRADFLLGQASEAGTFLQGSESLTDEDFDRGEDQLRAVLKKSMGKPSMQNAMSQARSDILTYARAQGAGGKSMLPEDMEKQWVNSLINNGMSPAEAKDFVKANRKTLMQHSFKWAGDSSVPDVQKAVNRTRDSGAKASRSDVDMESLNENREDIEDDLAETFYELGFTATEDAPVGLEKAATTKFFEEEDSQVQAAAIAMAAAESHGDKDVRDTIAKQVGKLDPKILKKARDLNRNLTGKQKERFAERFGKDLASGDLTVDTMGKQLGAALGMTGGDTGKFGGVKGVTELALVDQYRKDKGLDVVTTETGGTTAEGEKKVKKLDDQDKMLADMAGGMNKASGELLQAAKILQSGEIVKKLTGYKRRSWD